MSSGYYRNQDKEVLESSACLYVGGRLKEVFTG